MWILGWIVFSIVAGFVGSGRKIGFGWAFFWSLLLSPLIGLIIAFASDKKSDVELRAVQEKQAEAIQVIKENSKKSVTDQIKEAKDLLDSGTITEEEFDNLKKKLLNS
ncbi:SHOCT domain-containing protein [Parabacteroides sp. HGS0025]|jgi:phosphate/sulfate permease|uniref:SHOCT domain-containing protein n=1 Tax=Parabacteroides sp. HGS0025 TaxID=1078087 RepID=UPI0006175A7F|nr:SHOCT domain-containing protein [Parabacteroides sp. HGS0025]KKB45122.1 hypothetical protein HMPREF1212_05290 [Parabacteroides sp. HGS0025]DAP41609.1 MAG TPA: Short C-terminal domain [Caudoviricetes sp.]